MPEEPGAPRKIVDVHELIDSLNLRDVRYFELGAVLNEAATLDEGLPETVDIEVTFGTSFHRHHDGLGLRARLELPHPLAKITVDAAIEYVSSEPIDYSIETLIEFADNVGILALYPYLRQASYDLGQRLGVHHHLPMVKRGELSFRPLGKPDTSPDSDD